MFLWLLKIQLIFIDCDSIFNNSLVLDQRGDTMSSGWNYHNSKFITQETHPVVDRSPMFRASSVTGELMTEFSLQPNAEKAPDFGVFCFAEQWKFWLFHQSVRYELGVDIPTNCTESQMYFCWSQEYWRQSS